MKRLNLPLITATLFSFACIFLASFTIFNYFIKIVPITAIFSFLIGFLGAFLCFLYISSKQRKKLILAYDKKQTELLSLHLCLSTETSTFGMLEKCFDATQIDGRLETDDTAFFVCLDIDGLERKHVARAIKNPTSLKKRIVCVGASQGAKALADSFAIDIITVEQLYPLLKSKGLLPEKYIFEDGRKPTFFKRVKARFNKKLCPSLFLSGVGLLALSNFTFFPVYYVICGTLLLLLACISLLISA